MLASESLKIELDKSVVASECTKMKVEECGNGIHHGFAKNNKGSHNDMSYCGKTH